MLALAILVMAACKPFVDASSCDETQGAINDANFFILTSLPPLNGEVQSVQIVGSVLITGGLLLLAYSGYVIWQVVPGLNVSASWAVQGANVSAVVGIAGVAMLAFGLLLALRQITAAPLSRLGLIGAPPAPPKR